MSNNFNDVDNIVDPINNDESFESIDEIEEIFTDDFAAPPATAVSNTISKEMARNRRNKLEKALCDNNNIWNYSNLGLEAKAAATKLVSSKNGLYSKIPLLCKGKHCPYKDSCKLLPFELAPVGEYCPVETSQIELTVAKYANEFGIAEEDFTDQNILKEIVNLEIIMERCKALMAIEQSPVVDVITAITETGDTWTHPEISKAFEIYDKCQRQHTNLLSLMNATRKDKRGTVSTTGNSISDILNRINEIERNGGFVEPTEPIDTPYEDKTYS